MVIESKRQQSEFIPISEIPLWINDMETDGITASEQDKFAVHHYTQNVRAAISEGLSLDEFRNKVKGEIENHSGYSGIDPQGINDTLQVIGIVWERESKK